MTIRPAYEIAIDDTFNHLCVVEEVAHEKVNKYTDLYANDYVCSKYTEFNNEEQSYIIQEAVRLFKGD